MKTTSSVKCFVGLAAILTLCLVCGTAMAYTAMTWEVIVDEGIKTYSYTLFSQSNSIEGLEIFMPAAGAKSVIEWGSTDPGFHGHYEGEDDEYYWRWLFYGGEITSGQNVTFTLKTPAIVPTSYSFSYLGRDYNWLYSGWTSYDDTGHGWWHWGDSILPVPVPEPSSILALLCGMGGLAGAVLKRRH